MNYTLKYLSKKSETLGSQISYHVFFDLYDYNSVRLDGDDETYLELLANSGCIGSEDLFFLLSYLEKCGLVERIGRNNRQQTCTLTVEGYARLSELERAHSTSSRAFVAMWFDDSMNNAWERGFDPAIRSAGYEPVRIDRQEHVNKIDDEILAEIRRARFVVADFTHGTLGARGGVYCEAGFAHGLAIPVIFTCQKASFAQVHFDTRQYNHIVWGEPKELQERLTNRIAAVIGDGPHKA